MENKSSQENAEWVEVKSIKADPFQPRKSFSQAHIESLAKDIQISGLRNAVEIDENYIIVTGECRFRAMKSLGWKNVPVKISKKEYTPRVRLEDQLGENKNQSGGNDKDKEIPSMNKSDAYARVILMRYCEALEPGQPGRPGIGIINKQKLINTYSREILIREYKKLGLEIRKSGGKIESIVDKFAEERDYEPQTIYEYLALFNEPEFVQKALSQEEKKIPRTYFREANKAKLEARDKIKKRIVDGQYENREDIIRDARLSKRNPNIAAIQLNRRREKESKSIHRILDNVANMALALDESPLDNINPRERIIIIQQLNWIISTIEKYLQTQAKEQGVVMN